MDVYGKTGSGREVNQRRRRGVTGSCFPRKESSSKKRSVLSGNGKGDNETNAGSGELPRIARRLQKGRTGLAIDTQFKIEGLLGISLDKGDVFLININETANINPQELEVDDELTCSKSPNVMQVFF